MVMRERTALGAVLVLGLVGGWFASVIWQEGLATDAGMRIFIAGIAIVVLMVPVAIVMVLGGRGRKVDERDHRIALMSQTFRGYLYLILSFGLFGLAMASGDNALMNAIFLAVLGIEIISGLVMMALYRFSACGGIDVVS